MGETFKQLFARISPSRRAGVVFGMDQLHRKYLAKTGGSSQLPYDAAEHLTDEETIKAYLAIVRQAEDHHIMMQARVDAARARNRLSQGATLIDEAPSGPDRMATWPRSRETVFRNHLLKSELERMLAKSRKLTAQHTKPGSVDEE
jgi:hypothetical protein